MLFLAVLLCATWRASSQEFDIDHLYPIETIHSYVQFEVTYMGYAKVRGNFGSFYGSIYYNPEAPDQTSISFQIDVESISTNNDWRDGDLKSANWFLAEEYPYIRFISERVTVAEEGLAVVGDLTIKETTKSIEFSIPFPQGVIHDIRGDDQVIFTGSYALNRKEYGVMGKNWSQVKEGIAALADEVTIEFSLLGKQMNAENFSNFLRNPDRPPGAIYAAYQEGGLEHALDRYETLQRDTAVEVNAHALNSVGYMLLLQEKYDDARALLLRNASDFPQDANVYDSLGELSAAVGDLDQASSYYQQAFAKDPNNMNAFEVLKWLQ